MELVWYVSLQSLAIGSKLLKLMHTYANRLSMDAAHVNELISFNQRICMLL